VRLPFFAPSYERRLWNPSCWLKSCIAVRDRTRFNPDSGER